MNRKRFWSGKLYSRGIQGIGSRFYVNPDSDLRKSILVAGTGRSGTMWLGDLIASQIPSRILFEPFNPDLVKAYRGFHYFQYMQPGVENPEFHSFAEKVFTGDIRHRWVDHQNEQIFPKYRLIKEFRINLALKWLHENFPEVPIVFLLRHPCAVVLSRMELSWATDSGIQPFLSQPDLVQDFLDHHLGFILNARTEEEKYAIIWCISNLVPLQQFKPGELKLVYYENLCTQLEVEVPAILSSIEQKYTKPVMGTYDRPSQTTQQTSAVVSGTDKLSNWKKKLETSQIENILRVVERFGLDHLYDGSVLPLESDAI